MATKKKKTFEGATHVAVRPIKHDGKFYAVGDAITLTEDQADELNEHVSPLNIEPAE